MNQSIFKAYDVRGRYPGEINEGIVRSIARSVSKNLGSGKIVIARDARLSSLKLYRAAINAVHRIRGSRVVGIGLSTTPMFYFLVNHLRAAGGIMITASHNPKKFNGLKVVGPNAIAIGGREIYKLATND